MTAATESAFDHWTFSLNRDLDAVLRAKLPAQWVEIAMEAVLSESSPLVTPEAHTAAIRRETEWQHHWMEKCNAAERKVHQLQNILDLTTAKRVGRVLSLVADLRPSRTAKHDETCHERHAPCLAARIRAALNGNDE